MDAMQLEGKKTLLFIHESRMYTKAAEFGDVGTGGDQNK